MRAIDAALVVGLVMACNTRALSETPGLHLAEPEANAAASLPEAPSARSDDSPPQTEPAPLEAQPHSSVTITNTVIHGISDLGHIAVSPVYLRRRDLKWLLPLTGAAIAAFATDETTMKDVVNRDPSFYQSSVNISDGLRDGLIALPVAMFGVGQLEQRPHARETGILAGEAMVDALVVDEIAKLSTFRERPLLDNAQGEFYMGNSGGADSSFVSGHSMIAWSSAAVIAGEYHSRWVRVAVYTAATAVSVTRVTGQQHFPSDVLIGSAGGWLIGHYVYRAHHHADMTTDTK